MAKKTFLNGNATPENEQSIIVVAETTRNDYELTNYSDSDLPEESTSLTNEELLEQKLKRLEHQKDLAAKRKSYLSTYNDIVEYLQEMNEADNEEEFFDSVDLSLKFYEGRAEKMSITNPCVLQAFLLFSAEQLSTRIQAINSELLGN